MKTSRTQKNNGAILIYLLVIIFVFSAMMLPVITLLVSRMKVLATTIERENPSKSPKRASTITNGIWLIIQTITKTVRIRQGHMCTITPTSTHSKPWDNLV